MQIQTPNIALAPINFDNSFNIKVHILRLDLLHQIVSGNKWFKLKLNTERAKAEGKKTILTFGGAFSNHIVATAYSAQAANLNSIGIIRGEKVANHTLENATKYGMKLFFVSRTLYADKNELNKWVSENFDTGICYIIPEGGANALGAKGCEEIRQLIPIPFQYICTPCGTATTLAGISNSLKTNEEVLGFSALKNGNFLEEEAMKFINTDKQLNFKIITDYHFGGYAKHTPVLIQFMNDFKQQHHITLDFIYTAKMMFGIFDLINKGYFKPDSTVIAIHTGGLQGNLGLKV